MQPVPFVKYLRLLNNLEDELTFVMEKQKVKKIEGRGAKSSFTKEGIEFCHVIFDSGGTKFSRPGSPVTPHLQPLYNARKKGPQNGPKYWDEELCNVLKKYKKEFKGHFSITRIDSEYGPAEIEIKTNV
jgi:hypothetical protein